MTMQLRGTLSILLIERAEYFFKQQTEESGVLAEDEVVEEISEFVLASHAEVEHDLAEQPFVNILELLLRRSAFRDFYHILS